VRLDDNLASGVTFCGTHEYNLVCSGCTMRVFEDTNAGSADSCLSKLVMRINE
jgi:hypothetical protein